MQFQRTTGSNMSKNDAKKSKKSADSAIRKAALKAQKDAPVIREAWIAAIEAGAAAAIAVIRQASDAELVKLADAAGGKTEKKSKKKAAEPEAQETKPAITAA